MEGFLPKGGGYRNLTAFKKAECIYDITYYFAHKYISNNDRTRDQMIQAARSGKQNIAEGSAASSTSKETEIKLMNVAKASLHELLLDYEDYLRVRNLSKWKEDSPKLIQTRRICGCHNETNFYIERIEKRSDETICNIAITLLHQVDVLLRKLINRLESDFLRLGGIKEQMFRARVEFRNQQKF